MKQDEIKEFYIQLARLSTRLVVGRKINAIDVFEKVLRFSDKHLLSKNHKSLIKLSKDAIKENIRLAKDKKRENISKFEEQLAKLREAETDEVECYICYDIFPIPLEEKEKQEKMQEEIIDDEGFLYMCEGCKVKYLKMKKIIE